MDPYYFLNLDIEYTENTPENKRCELMDWCDMEPNCNWKVGFINNDEFKILYNQEEYDMISYKNNIISFYTKDKLVKKLEIKMKELEL